MLFKKYNTSYKLLPEKPINLEKDIQKVIESNLDVFFGLEFITSEFKVAQFRCDTFAFDSESKSFVVIEYKKRTDKGLFDQGLGYFELMSSRQADFLTEYNESKNMSLQRKDVDWSQSKIIFISPGFNKSQIQAANFKVNIELWEIHLYDNILELNKIHSDNETPLPVGEKQAKVIEKFKAYTEEFHYKQRDTEKTRPLYEKFRHRILLIPNVQMNVKKHYIAFKTNFNFVSFTLLKSKLVINLVFDEKESKDPRGLVQNLSDKGHWGAGNHAIYVTDDKDIDYIMGIILNSYKISANKTLSDVANAAVKTRKKNVNH